MRINKTAVFGFFVNLIMCTTSFASSAMLSNPLQLTTETQLQKNYHTVINHFWKTHTDSGYFIGTQQKKVYTVSLKAGHNKAIVISQGRAESTLKYKELAYDLHQQGYDLYLIDHRGQGFSQRLGGDNQRGHVERFQDYVDDLNRYILSLQLTHHYQNSYLLGHSMGATISALYLQQFDHPFQAGVFFSPMLSLNLGMPESLAKIITYSSAKICSWFYNKPCYVFAGSGYKQTEFTDNQLTASELRFNLSTGTFIEQPETQLGSPTMHWVSESISAMNNAIKDAHKITIPILIIQAGTDDIVTNSGQNEFLKNLTFCEGSQLMRVSGAKHEILLEVDHYRIPALTRALQFLSESRQEKCLR